MSEEAFVTAVLLALIAVVLGTRREDWIWATSIAFGFAIAAAVFIRPLGIVLLPVPLALLLSQQVKPKIALTHAAIGALLVLAILTPWTIRNHNQVGGWNLISNNGGINLWIGCHLNPDGGIASNGKWMDWWSGDAPAEINTSDERANDRQAQSLALECMREEPFAFARLSLLKGLYTFREDWEYVSKWSINHDLPERPREAIVGRPAEEAFGYLSNSVYIALLPLAVIGGAAFFLSSSIYRGVIGAAFAGLALVPLAFFGDPRFHVPLFPIMSIWAAGGISIVVHGLRTVGQQEKAHTNTGDPVRAFDWRQEPWLR
jgi:4-amino-4-deoxy-L-arabinose transferase-like glycosyltransferase